MSKAAEEKSVSIALGEAGQFIFCIWRNKTEETEKIFI
jgi:hypothetical protein